MATFCGAKLKPRSFHQAAIAIGREYIPPHLDLDHGQSAIDASADHTESVAHTHYAIVEGDLPHLSVDSIVRFKDVDYAWHNILGVGR